MNTLGDGGHYVPLLAVNLIHDFRSMPRRRWERLSRRGWSANDALAVNL